MLTALAISPPTLAAQDFGRDFERLFDLGLADPKGGNYVATDLQAREQAYEGIVASDLLGNELQGHGWLLPIPEGQDFPLLVTFGAIPCLLITTEQVEELVGEHDDSAMLAAARNRAMTGLYRQAAGAGYGIVISDTTPVDPAADVRWWTEVLEDDERWREITRGHGPGPARLFIIAACWHRQGETELAARLAKRMLSDADDPASLLAAVAHQIADNQYDMAMAKLSVGAADWQQTEAALRDLVQRFGHDWPKAQAVEVLADRLRRRVAVGGDAPPLDPQLEDEPAAEAVEWWRRVDAVDFPSHNDQPWRWRNRHFRGVGPQLLTLWISGKSWYDDDAGQGLGGGGPEEPVSALWADLADAGPNAILWLAAGLGDDTLLPWVMQGSGAERGSSTPLLSGGGFPRADAPSVGELSDTELHQSYRKLTRPMTRGELAQALLHGLGDHRVRERVTLDDVHEFTMQSALDLHDRIGGTNGLELAAILLKDYEHQFADHIVAALMDDERDESRQFLERTLLEHPGRQSNNALAYVRQHRADAADFVAAWRALVDDEGDHLMRRALYQMEFLLSGQSFDQLVAALLADDSVSPTTFDRHLRWAIDSESDEPDYLAPLTLLLKVAAATDHMVKLQTLLDSASSLAIAAGRQAEGELDAASLPGELTAAVEALLKDTRLLPGVGWYDMELTPARFAQSMMIALLDPSYRFQQLFNDHLTSAERREHISQAFQTLWSGDAAPVSLPFEPVSAERLSELVEQWQNMTADRVEAAAEALALTERVALSEELEKWAEAPTGLRARSWSITSVRISDSAKLEDADWWRALEGHPLDERLLYRIVLRAHRAAADQRRLTVSLEQGSLGRGIQITVAERHHYDEDHDETHYTFESDDEGDDVQVAGILQWGMTGVTFVDATAKGRLIVKSWIISYGPIHHRLYRGYHNSVFGYIDTELPDDPGAEGELEWENFIQPASEVTLEQGFAQLMERADDYFSIAFRFYIGVGIPEPSE